MTVLWRRWPWHTVTHWHCVRVTLLTVSVCACFVRIILLLLLLKLLPIDIGIALYHRNYFFSQSGLCIMHCSSGNLAWPQRESYAWYCIGDFLFKIIATTGIAVVVSLPLPFNSHQTDCPRQLRQSDQTKGDKMEVGGGGGNNRLPISANNRPALSKSAHWIDGQPLLGRHNAWTNKSYLHQADSRAKLEFHSLSVWICQFLSISVSIQTTLDIDILK